jgi:hypothetical protein
MKFHFAFARHSRESGNPAFDLAFLAKCRVPVLNSHATVESCVEMTSTAKTGFPLSRE